eukprot:3054391-Rhodomonas_salina.1
MQAWRRVCTLSLPMRIQVMSMLALLLLVAPPALSFLSTPPLRPGGLVPHTAACRGNPGKFEDQPHSMRSAFLGTFVTPGSAPNLKAAEISMQKFVKSRPGCVSLSCAFLPSSSAFPQRASLRSPSIQRARGSFLLQHMVRIWLSLCVFLSCSIVDMPRRLHMWLPPQARTSLTLRLFFSSEWKDRWCLCFEG